MSQNPATEANILREFDFDRPIGQGQQHIAREKDITLAENHLNFNLDDPMYEFDLGGGGIGSQDFDYDIGVNFGEAGGAGGADGQGPAKSSRKGKGKAGEEEEDGMSVEMGMRDSSVDPRHGRVSLDSGLRGAGADGDFDDVFGAGGSRSGMDEFGVQGEFGGDMGMDIDLGIDFGEGDRMRSERPKTPDAPKDPHSRACESEKKLFMSFMFRLLTSLLHVSDPRNPASGNSAAARATR